MRMFQEGISICGLGKAFVDWVKQVALPKVGIMQSFEVLKGKKKKRQSKVGFKFSLFLAVDKSGYLLLSSGFPVLMPLDLE